MSYSKRIKLTTYVDFMVPINPETLGLQKRTMPTMLLSARHIDLIRRIRATELVKIGEI